MAPRVHRHSCRATTVEWPALEAPSADVAAFEAVRLRFGIVDRGQDCGVVLLNVAEVGWRSGIISINLRRVPGRKATLDHAGELNA